jgi:hypothetical protein
MKRSRMMTAATVLGIVAGIGGASHGPGEMLQGSVVPAGLVIEAWPGLVALRGEPAMTIVPDMMVTGVLAIIAGLAVAAWSATRLRTRNGGPALMLLSAIMLLVGGGLYPPVLGIMAGIMATEWAGETARNRRGRAEVAAVLVGLFLMAAVLISVASETLA